MGRVPFFKTRPAPRDPASFGDRDPAGPSGIFLGSRIPPKLLILVIFYWFRHSGSRHLPQEIPLGAPPSLRVTQILNGPLQFNWQSFALKNDMEFSRERFPVKWLCVSAGNWSGHIFYELWSSFVFIHSFIHSARPQGEFKGHVLSGHHKGQMEPKLGYYRVTP